MAALEDLARDRRAPAAGEQAMAELIIVETEIALIGGPPFQDLDVVLVHGRASQLQSLRLIASTQSRWRGQTAREEACERGQTTLGSALGKSRPGSSDYNPSYSSQEVDRGGRNSGDGPPTSYHCSRVARRSAVRVRRLDLPPRQGRDCGAGSAGHAFCRGESRSPLRPGFGLSARRMCRSGRIMGP